MIVSIDVEIPDGAVIDGTIGVVSYLVDNGAQGMSISRANCGTISNAVGLCTRAAFALDRGGPAE